MALAGHDASSPLNRFLTTNSIHIDAWYDALKYPEDKHGTAYSHFELKFGGRDAIAFWNQVRISSAEIHSLANSLCEAQGYA